MDLGGIVGSIAGGADKILGSSAGNFIGDLGGSLFGSAMSAKEAEKQRDWQYMMSGTAYRRAKNDLIKAGMNPILAAFSGGASTPSGAMGSVQDMSDMVPKAVQSAAAYKTMKASVKKIENDAQIAKHDAKMRKYDSQLKHDAMMHYRRNPDMQRMLLDSYLMNEAGTPGMFGSLGGGLGALKEKIADAGANSGKSVRKAVKALDRAIIALVEKTIPEDERRKRNAERVIDQVSQDRYERR